MRALQGLALPQDIQCQGVDRNLQGLAQLQEPALHREQTQASPFAVAPVECWVLPQVHRQQLLGEEP